MTHESETIRTPVDLRSDILTELETIAKAQGRDLGWALDQAAERFVRNERLSAELAALTAEAETVEADGRRQPMAAARPDCLVPCICCGRPMEEHGSNQPSGGLAFQCSGHWPSAVFDNAPGWIEINVCEPCLFAAAERGRILHGDRAGRGAPTAFVTWAWPDHASKPEGASTMMPIGPGGMSAGTLAALLGRQPPDRRVVLKGYENGYSDLSGVRDRPLKRDVNPNWWSGPHEAEKDAPDEIAVEIVRIDRDPD